MEDNTEDNAKDGRGDKGRAKRFGKVGNTRCTG